MKLAGHQNVSGFKDSIANYENFKQLLDTLSEKLPEFYLLQGKEHLLKDSLAAGASGLVVSLLHVHPQPFVMLYESVKNGDLEKADVIQQAISSVLQLITGCFSKEPATSTLFHFLNHTLRQRGLEVNICLEHEGDCPDWIAEKAERALQICRQTIDAAAV
ncbi:MAG: hypothetical protein GWP14_03140 [Actinobacteria bacterium]|nr:hypothetical protein [Actinomycetota bacterium]